MKESFKPYIPADRGIPEMTPLSMVLGFALAVIFGAANAYLGLRVGMTVSASIPAAVISMAVIRVIMRRDSILENNMVQTIGSAGEALAGGAIFTMPALFIWENEGVIEKIPVISIAGIALLGGLLGVLFMVPLRRALIVKEHGVLPYPEGTACAEVLLAGEGGGSSAASVFQGMGIAAAVKFLIDGLKLSDSVIKFKLGFLKTEFAAEVYPSLISVGFICGTRISAYMFAGGVIGWLVLIPVIALFGSNMVMYPASVPVSELYAAGGAEALWAAYVKYIGAGAVATAGIISLIQAIPLIARTFAEAMRSIRSGGSGAGERTGQDLDMRIVLGGIAVLILAIWLVPFVPVSLAGAVIIAVLGFFFCTVSARMVGIVGGSNNPVSGMTIATVLLTTLFLKASGETGTQGMTAAIAVGAVISIAASMAGDTSQDLKTGYLLGATPKMQQIGEMIGVAAASLIIGFVLILLDRAYGFGSSGIPSPQATMMKMIVEGTMSGNLPWELIFIGAFIAAAVSLLGVPALPVAIGLYLPIEMTAAVVAGGFIRYLTNLGNTEGKAKSDRAILFCSGLIAGEGLVGVLLAVLTVAGVAGAIDMSGLLGESGILSVLIPMMLLLMMGTMIYRSGTGGKTLS